MFGTLTTLATTVSALFLGVSARNRIEPNRVPPQLPEFAQPPQLGPPRKGAPPPRRVPHYQTPKLACVALPKACDLLIDWMNGEGLTGLYTAGEIDEYWGTACHMLDLEPIDCQTIREALASKGLWVGPKRLNLPEYIHIRQRTGKTRLVLYRIPRCRGAAAATPDQLPASSAQPAARRSIADATPAHVEKPSENRRRAA